MTSDFYTLIVVPHAKARFRKFQVSVKLTKWALGVSTVLALAILGMLVHYTRIAVAVADLQRLRSDNEGLTAKTRAYEENAGKLKAQVDSLQKMVTKLGVMAGLESSLPEPGVGGVGGVPSRESTLPSADIGQSLSSMGTNV